MIKKKGALLHNCCLLGGGGGDKVEKSTVPNAKANPVA